MDQFTKPIDLGIAEKLKKDESYRKAFFRASTADSIALQIREFRSQLGLKQADLAAAADMKQSAVSRIEQAEYSSWTFNTLWRIAEALNARLTVRFEFAEDAIREYEPGGEARAAITSYADVAKLSNEYQSGFYYVGTASATVQQRVSRETATLGFRKSASTDSPILPHGIEHHV